jgi:hypothetical protein
MLPLVPFNHNLAKEVETSPSTGPLGTKHHECSRSSYDSSDAKFGSPGLVAIRGRCCQSQTTKYIYDGHMVRHISGHSSLSSAHPTCQMGLLLLLRALQTPRSVVASFFL